MSGILALGLGTVKCAQAATFNVPAGDEDALIEAINDANSNGQPDNIILGGGTYNLVEAADNSSANTGLPDITSAVTISVDIGKATIRRFGMAQIGILNVTSTGALALIDVVISGGITNSAGAGIRNDGTLVVIDSELSGHISFSGSAVLNTGWMSVANSVVKDNEATADGGAIRNDGTLMIASSVLYNNQAGRGGGAIVNVGVLSATNTTFSGNQADVDGGAVKNTAIIDSGQAGTATFNNVTMTNNVADANESGNGNGGGLLNGSNATLTLLNTIVAHNVDNGGEAPDCAGTVDSDGYNLIEDTSGCNLVGNLSGNITGQNPYLGPLQDNGGPTETHQLLASSPAIDAGHAAQGNLGSLIQRGPDALVPDSTCEPDDQRGVSRPIDGDGDGIARCDIGAYEFGALIPPKADDLANPTNDCPTGGIVWYFDTIEAEDGSLVGAVVADDVAGFTGSGFVDFQTSNGDFAVWDVNVPADGHYRLQFRYGLASGDRPLKIEANHHVVEASLSFPATGSFSTWDTVSICVSLEAGHNTLQASTIGYSGANIDHIKVLASLTTAGAGSDPDDSIYLPPVFGVEEDPDDGKLELPNDTRSEDDRVLRKPQRPTEIEIPFRRGDANDDGKVDLSDATKIFFYLFAGGEEPNCMDTADSNDDSKIDLTDGLVITGYLFLGNVRIPSPGPAQCGADPTTDGLGCQDTSGCE